MKSLPTLDAPAIPPALIAIKGLKYFSPLAMPPVVYFLCKKDEVVYVGKSRNLLFRITGHTDKDFDTTWVLPVPNSELNETETAYIMLLKPKYNGGVGRYVNNRKGLWVSRKNTEKENKAIMKKHARALRSQIGTLK